MDGIITGDQSSKWQKNLNGAATIGFRRTMGANKTFQQKGDRGRILGELIRAAPRLGYEGRPCATCVAAGIVLSIGRSRVTAG
jgi:hypothetical protein